jgi:hypothetical protein
MISFGYRPDKDNHLARRDASAHSAERDDHRKPPEREEASMSEHCRCGDPIRHVYESWTCTRCQRACCPACAEHDGDAALCIGCHQVAAA